MPVTLKVARFVPAWGLIEAPFSGVKKSVLTCPQSVVISGGLTYVWDRFAMEAYMRRWADSLNFRRIGQSKWAGNELNIEPQPLALKAQLLRAELERCQVTLLGIRDSD